MRNVHVAALGIALSLAAAVQASEIIIFNFALTGAQEVPPNNSNAVGAARLEYYTETKRFDIDLMVFGIGLGDLRGVGPNLTPAHIHLAPPGVNGPIVIDLGYLSGGFKQDGLGIRLTVKDALFGGQQGGVYSDPSANEAALFAGNLYANVHTNAYPGGQIRGQIVPEPSVRVLVAALGVLAVLRRR